MAEFCTCGAQLPPDALFCHKCGKPQREIGAVEPEIIVPPPMPTPVIEAPKVEPATVNFRNPEVLKVAVLSALLSTFLFFLPYLNWIAAGYFAVFFYRRRTRRTVNIAAGVRIGWITGLMAFAMMAVIVLFVVMMLRVPEVMTEMKRMAQNSQWFQQSLDIWQNPSMLGGTLVGIFVFTTLLGMTGGLLGAVLTGATPPRGGNIV